MFRVPAKSALVACAMVGLAVGVPGCRGRSGGWPFGRQPNIVLISIDTLRADRLPAYGFKGVETPAIDALRRDSILFENAYAHVPLTLPSHATIFTGRLPAASGVRDNAGYELKAGTATLAELLEKAGYATGGAVSAVVMAKSTGISRGFGFWDDRFEPPDPHAGLGEVQRPGLVTKGFLEEWIAARGKRPFFAFLHLYEPHSPYDPPEPFATRYSPDRYLGEIAAADSVVGRFLAFLKEKGLYDEALVVLFSDHGEGLGEHGEPEHGLFLYRETIRVPLIVKRPRAQDAGRAVPDPVGLVDLFPTILSAAGTRWPGGDGVPLLETAAGHGEKERRIFSETLYPRIHFGWSDLASLADSRWHYTEAPRPEIYDVREDPGERTNLIDRSPEGLRPMKAAMDRVVRSFEPPGSVTAEKKAQLASLGYLSAAAPAAGGPLPDPKDKVDVIAKIAGAASLVNAGRHADAAAAYEGILRENPHLADLWLVRATSLFRADRPGEAIAAARKGLEQASVETSPRLLQLLAEIHLRRGDTDEALRHARLAIEMRAPGAEFFLPEIYLARGEFGKAKEAARAAIEKTAYPSLPRLVLARILRAEGDLEGALAEVDRAGEALAAAHAPVLRSYHLFRGELLLALGRPADAVSEFEKELQVRPGDTDTLLELARASALAGRTMDARALMGQLVDADPRNPVTLQRAMIALEAGGDREGGTALRNRGRRLFPGDVRFQTVGGKATLPQRLRGPG
jgi:arylsulfatase A-like enzyme/Flp pilus assembly protein TadD